MLFSADMLFLDGRYGTKGARSFLYTVREGGVITKASNGTCFVEEIAHFPPYTSSAGAALEQIKEFSTHLFMQHIARSVDGAHRSAERTGAMTDDVIKSKYQAQGKRVHS